MFKEKVKDLLDAALEKNPSLFLIDFVVGPLNRIEVTIDGDNGVVVDDCIELSRAIEHNLDRDEEDFSLQVMSAGVTEGLVHKRQYVKNVGRIIEVTTKEKKIEGELIIATADDFTLQWKAREPKPIGKGKVTVVKTETIAFEDVVKANVVVKFN